MTGLQAPLAQHSSDAAGIADLLAGKVQTHFAGAGAVTEDIRSGKLRALGVTTLTRFELLPDVPPIADVRARLRGEFMVRFRRPAGAPAEIVDKLNREINAGLIDPKVKARISEIGHVPMPTGARRLREVHRRRNREVGQGCEVRGPQARVIQAGRFIFPVPLILPYTPVEKVTAAPPSPSL